MHCEADRRAEADFPFPAGPGTSLPSEFPTIRSEICIHIKGIAGGKGCYF